MAPTAIVAQTVLHSDAAAGSLWHWSGHSFKKSTELQPVPGFRM